MERDQILVAIVYDIEEKTGRGEPRDLIALQETAEMAVCLEQVLSALGYATCKVPIYDSLDDFRLALQALPLENTLVFNLCDDFGGESLGAVRVAHVIESVGLHYTGEIAASTLTCMNKAVTKRLLVERGVPTPDYQVFEQAGGPFELQFPVIVKPLSEDASLGIDFESVVRCQADLQRRVEYVVRQYRQPALVEEFIFGRELTVAMFGNGLIETLPISEVDYSAVPDPFRRILTYEAKWMTDSSVYSNTPVHCPAVLSPEEEALVLNAAREAYWAVGLRDYGRIDIRFDRQTPYVIDINEAPDLSPEAGFARAAEVAGYNYQQMVERIIQLALHRRGITHP